MNKIPFKIILFLFVLNHSVYCFASLTMIHQCNPTFYYTDDILEVTNEIIYTGQLAAIAVQVFLPDGFTYITGNGPDFPDTVKVAEENDCEFVWETIPLSPLQFSYTIQASDKSDYRSIINATVFYRESDTGEKLASPDEFVLYKMDELNICGSSVAYGQISSQLSQKNFYKDGSYIDIFNTINYKYLGSEIHSLTLTTLLPDNWTFAQKESSSTYDKRITHGNTVKTIWNNNIPECPFIFMYRLSVPEQEYGRNTINTVIEYVIDDGFVYRERLLPLSVRNYSPEVSTTNSSFFDENNEDMNSNESNCFISIVLD